MVYDNPNELVPEAVTGHGSTVAAWTLVLVMTVGLIVATVGFSVYAYGWMVAGIVVILLGAVAGIVLKSMGYGKDGKHTLARSAS